MCHGSVEAWPAALGMVMRGQEPPGAQGMGDGCAVRANCLSPTLPNLSPTLPKPPGMG